MSHTTYTATASYALPVGWKCTNCGQLNATTCTVSAKSSTSKSGLRHSQEFADLASQQAQQIASEHVLKIITDIEINKYSPIFQKCKCRKCSHIEPWATVKGNGLWIGLCLVGAVITGIFALISILLEDWSSMGISLGIAAMFLGFMGLSMKISSAAAKKMAPIFESLTDAQKPICTPDKEALRVRMTGILAQSPKDMIEINQVISRL